MRKIKTNPNEVRLLLSKYNQFPKHELIVMGLIPKPDEISKDYGGENAKK